MSILFTDKFLKNDRYVEKLRRNYNKTKLGKDYEDEYISKLKNVIDNMIPNGIRTISFSKQYNNPLMWSLYAGRHHGFCLIFQPEKNSISLRKNVATKYENYKLEKVNYSDEVDVNLSEMFDRDEKFNYSNVNSRYFKSLINKCILTKHPSWRNEEEYRIFGNFSISFSSDKNKNISESSFDRTLYYNKKQLIEALAKVIR